jgi:hypothetical protein
MCLFRRIALLMRAIAPAPLKPSRISRVQDGAQFGPCRHRSREAGRGQWTKPLPR